MGSLYVEVAQESLQPWLPSSHSEARRWISNGLGSYIAALYGRISSKDYLDILGDRVHYMMVMASSKTTMVQYISIMWLEIGIEYTKVR